MCYFAVIRDRHILLMYTVGPIACAVLSGGCSAVGGDHTVLFLYLCNVDSKERHEAATHTCDSTEESKKAATQWVTAYCGGEGGIRTHGPLRSHWFSRPAP